MTVTDAGYDVYYITRGVSYNISDYDSTTGLTFRYLGDQGFGLAPLHRITTRGPLQNGDSDIDFRLDPRIMQLPLMVVNESSAAPVFQHYQIRRKLLDIFRPQDSGQIMVQHLYILSGIVTPITRMIDVKVLGGLSFDVDPSSYHVRTVVQLRAADPTWYEPTSSGLRSQTIYSSGAINGNQTIIVGGNWPTFPIIRLTGPITNPVITNSTLGQTITITGTIAAGAYYDIDLEYGKKTVVDNGGVNRISTVSAASNLATWSLQSGNNVVSITGTGATAATNAVFQYYIRHIGI